MQNSSPQNNVMNNPSSQPQGMSRRKRLILSISGGFLALICVCCVGGPLTLSLIKGTSFGKQIDCVMAKVNATQTAQNNPNIAALTPAPNCNSN